MRRRQLKNVVSVCARKTENVPVVFIHLYFHRLGHSELAMNIVTDTESIKVCIAVNGNLRATECHLNIYEYPHELNTTRI